MTELNSCHIRISELDSAYHSFNDEKSFKKTFGRKTSMNEFGYAWNNFNDSLQHFLNENKFVWSEDSVNFRYRIYFNTDGSVAYWIIEFNPDISKKRELEYAELIQDFTQTHKMNIRAKKKFSMSGNESIMH
jgi:hypothetical protein